MKIKLDKSTGLIRKFSVVVDKLDIVAQVDKELQKRAPKIKMDGFRQGKVPVEVLKKNYFDTFFKNAISYYIEEARKEIIKENDLKLVVAPSFEENGEIAPDSDLKFYLIFEVWPTIPAIRYDKITVTAPVLKLSDAEISEQIQILADRVSEIKPVETEGYKSKKGDIVYIDYLGKVDGVAFDGGMANNHELELGSGTFIPGFEDQLIGCVAGSDVLVKVKFPDEYHHEALKGKDAEFETKINKICEKIPPVLDDELAKKFGCDSFEDLRDKIKSESIKEYTKEWKSIVGPRVLMSIADDYKFDLPESVLKQEIEARMKKLNEENDKSEKKLSEKEVAKKAAEESAMALKVAYLKDHFIAEYKISTTDDDLREYLVGMSRSNGVDIQQMLGIYNQYPDFKRQALSAIQDRKIYDNLIPLCKNKTQDMTKAESDKYFEKLHSDQKLF